jgi:hypothetical protein
LSFLFLFFFDMVILVFWLKSWVWNVNSYWHRSFFLFFVHRFLFFNCILQHCIYWRLNFFIFSVCFHEYISTSRSGSWILYTNLDWLKVFTSFYFIFYVNLVLILLIVFFLWIFFFKLIFFYQCHPSTLEWLRIGLHNYFWYHDFSLMTRFTSIKC